MCDRFRSDVVQVVRPAVDDHGGHTDHLLHRRCGYPGAEVC